MSSLPLQLSRISVEMLDQLVSDRDPQELSHSDELFVDLKKRHLAVDPY